MVSPRAPDISVKGSSTGLIRHYVYPHIAAMTFYCEYSKLMQSIYVADLIMEFKGDYNLETLDKNVKMIKQVRALSNDYIHVSYLWFKRA